MNVSSVCNGIKHDDISSIIVLSFVFTCWLPNFVITSCICALFQQMGACMYVNGKFSGNPAS